MSRSILYDRLFRVLELENEKKSDCGIACGWYGEWNSKMKCLDDANIQKWECIYYNTWNGGSLISIFLSIHACVLEKWVKGVWLYILVYIWCMYILRFESSSWRYIFGSLYFSIMLIIELNTSKLGLVMEYHWLLFGAFAFHSQILRL